MDFRGVEWIRLVQDRDQWRALVNALMNLRVLGRVTNLRRRKFRTTCLGLISALPPEIKGISGA
jgi:hypothetical protein